MSLRLAAFSGGPRMKTRTPVTFGSVRGSVCGRM
jgi:hypothetical protein